MARAKVRIEMDSELEGLVEGFNKQTAEKQAAALKKTNWLKLAAGRHIIRILPARKGAASPFAEVYQHYVKIPGGKDLTINCPQKQAGKHCPICAKCDEMRNSEIEADKKWAKDTCAKLTVFVNAVRRKPEGDEEVGVLRLPRTVYEEVLALGKHPDVLAEYEDIKPEWSDDGFVDMTHPTLGFDIRIEKTGEKMNTKYKVEVAGRTHGTPALPSLDKLKEVLKGMTDLNGMAKLMSESEINTALMGPTDAPALPERSAEHAAHDAPAPIDAEASDDSEDGEDIPF